MVIVLVIDMFHTNNNGTSVSARRFANALCERGHTVRVVTWGDPGKSGTDPESGLHMYYVPEMKLPIASALAHKQHTLFAKPVKETLTMAIQGADVVHIFEPWPLGSAARRIAKRLHVPAMAAFHTQPENITYNTGLGWLPLAAHFVYFMMYLLFYRRFSHIHCPSKFIAAQLRRHGYKAWLHVISNGVHPDFHPAGSPRERENGLFKVLMVGRLSPEKRQDVLIRAVRQSKYAGRIQLYFAGQGPWEKRLRRMGSKLPNPPIFGYYDRPALVSLMQGCDLYVHASDIEIEGIACMEAFSCGLVPVIADSKRSATRQFALGPEHLFKAGDPASLAKRIDEWYDSPHCLREAGERYAKFGQTIALDKSIRQMERVYASMNLKKKNIYHHSRLYNLISRLFTMGIAFPILQVFIRVIAGDRIRGMKNLRGLDGALTVCNHVHTLDSAIVGLALFPRRTVFPTLPKNLHTLWPGKIMGLLGCVAVPETWTDMKPFFDEMEFQLLRGRIVHFFPEGELRPYATCLQRFKSGAFHLAAKARVPLVPMSITFQKTRGLRRLIRKKPVMVLTIGRPIWPAGFDIQEDSQWRMDVAWKQMNEILERSVVS